MYIIIYHKQIEIKDFNYKRQLSRLRDVAIDSDTYQIFAKRISTINSIACAAKRVGKYYTNIVRNIASFDKLEIFIS